MPDAGTLDALSRLSAGALLVGAIVAIMLRYVYVRGEVKDREDVWRERLDEANTRGDEWRAIAESSLRKLDRLTDVVETLAGRKIPE